MKTKSNIIRVASAISVVAITAFVFYVFTPLGIDSTYLAVVRVLSAIFLLLVLFGFALVVLEKAQSGVLKRTVITLTVVTLVCLILYTIGPMQDWLGVRCTDIWGWNTEPCAKSTQGWLFFILLYPYVFPPLTLLAIGFLAYGLLQERSKLKSGVRK